MCMIKHELPETNLHLPFFFQSAWQRTHEPDFDVLLCFLLKGNSVRKFLSLTSLSTTELFFPKAKQKENQRVRPFGVKCKTTFLICFSHTAKLFFHFVKLIFKSSPINRKEPTRWLSAYFQFQCIATCLRWVCWIHCSERNHWKQIQDIAEWKETTKINPFNSVTPISTKNRTSFANQLLLLYKISFCIVLSLALRAMFLLFSTVGYLGNRQSVDALPRTKSAAFPFTPWAGHVPVHTQSGARLHFRLYRKFCAMCDVRTALKLQFDTNTFISQNTTGSKHLLVMYKLQKEEATTTSYTRHKIVHSWVFRCTLYLLRF